MKKSFFSTMITLIVGAVFGVGFVLSCSDNSPRRTDAAACDCPIGEPPLAGRFVTVSTGATTTIAAGQGDGTSVTCPAGSQVITGSCTTAVLNPVPANLVLIESGFFNDPPELPTGWSCFFKNNGTAPVTIKATVVCLKPGS